MTAGVLLNKTSTSSVSSPISNNVNKPVSSIQDNIESSAYSLQSTFDKETQSFNVTVTNGRNGLGILKLVDVNKLNSSRKTITSEEFKGALVDTLKANAGDKIYVTVGAEEGYELRNLKSLRC